MFLYANDMILYFKKHADDLKKTNLNKKNNHFEFYF